MTERTQGDQPASADSHGEVPSKKDSLQTRRTERRVGIEVQNVTDHLQCLSIASANSDMDLFPDDVGDELEQVNGIDDTSKELLGATSADFSGMGSKETLQSGFSGMGSKETLQSGFSGVGSKETLQYSFLEGDVDGDKRNQEMEQESLHRKETELNMRTNRLRDDMDLESRKLHPANNKFNQLISQVDSLSEDIYDFIDENPFNEIGKSFEDIDTVITKMEKMRSDFRLAHKELRMSFGERRYSESFEGYYKQKLNDIKVFLNEVRYRRKSLRDVEDRAKDSQYKTHKLKLQFLRNEIIRIITHLSNKFHIELSTEDDEEIKKRKDELVSDIKSIGTIPKKIEEL